jgi:hypothetical protein
MLMRVMGLKIFVSSGFCFYCRFFWLNGVVAFAENLVLTVHPSKSGGDWWYGTTLKDGKSGLFPKTYIEVFQTSISFILLYGVQV